MKRQMQGGVLLAALLLGTGALAVFAEGVRLESLEGYKRAVATVFWVGEESGPENDFIPNDVSAWDSYWQEHYGGVDDPERRCGFRPCAFIPKENPFYVALPYNDLTDEGVRKPSAQAIPWFAQRQDEETVLKNSWVEVRMGGKSCYGQWEDVGPLETDDFAYVFGGRDAANTWGEGAGIDISPALRDCLTMDGSAEVYWRFVSESEVPPGPWSEVVTTSGAVWWKPEL